jgi:hypothetical protein
MSREKLISPPPVYKTSTEFFRDILVTVGDFPHRARAAIKTLFNIELPEGSDPLGSLRLASAAIEKQTALATCDACSYEETCRGLGLTLIRASNEDTAERPQYNGFVAYCPISLDVKMRATATKRDTTTD